MQLRLKIEPNSPRPQDWEHAGPVIRIGRSAQCELCLAEAQVAELRRCIRLNQDCADICSITARLVSRLLQPEVGVLRAQLEACALICASCGAECRKHAQHHEHCTVCADACRRCDEQCRKALSSLQAAA